MADETNAIALLWKVLYGEELEQTPDPNKPENLPYYKARREQRRKELSFFNIHYFACFSCRNQ